MINSKVDLKGKFFVEPTDSVIVSIMEGNKGDIWVDNEDNPKIAFGFDGVYGYMDGDVTTDFVKEALEVALNCKKSDTIKIIPGNDLLINVILKALVETIQSINEKKHTDYSMSKKKRFLMEMPKEGFDKYRLKYYISLLPEDMQVKEIDRNIFEELKQDEELGYLVESYNEYSEFFEGGIGYVIKYNDTIVAGAISYSVFSEGIEIIFKTKEDYRNRGIGTAVAAILLEECSKTERKVIWDAANLNSVSIAEKFGYVLGREYYSFVIDTQKD